MKIMSPDDPQFFDLPKHAEKVFEGVIFDIWQWDQELFDGSHTTFEAGLRKPGGAAIATTGDKVIILHESHPLVPGMISLPAGCADSWEESSPLQVAQRELLEETGYQSETWEDFKSIKLGRKLRWEIRYYVARNCQKIADLRPDAGEKIKVKLVSFDEFLKLSDEPRFRNDFIIPELLRARFIPEEYEKLKKKLFG